MKLIDHATLYWKMAAKLAQVETPTLQSLPNEPAQPANWVEIDPNDSNGQPSNWVETTPNDKPGVTAPQPKAPNDKQIAEQLMNSAELLVSKLQGVDPSTKNPIEKVKIQNFKSMIAPLHFRKQFYKKQLHGPRAQEAQTMLARIDKLFSNPIVKQFYSEKLGF